MCRLERKFSGIFRLTIQHARNLGTFVTIYKTLMYLQKQSQGGVEHGLDSFFAGLVGGYWVFGNDSAVVQQVSPFPFLVSSSFSVLGPELITR